VWPARRASCTVQPNVPTRLTDIYDRAFFAEYGVRNAGYAAACRFIAGEIYRRFCPRTVVDWGCGAGIHAAALQRCGARVIAVDAVIADDEFREQGLDLRRADLTHAVPEGVAYREYDLSLCIDVLEHLREEDAASALANITRGAKLALLSCAPPMQGGHHHLNEQPRRYWIERMQAIDWRYDRRETGAMEQHFLRHRDRVPLSWMYHNLCVYRPEHVEA